MRGCAPVILVQRSALSKALGQIWVGQPPAPEHHHVSCAVLDGLVRERLGESAGRQKGPLQCHLPLKGTV